MKLSDDIWALIFLILAIVLFSSGFQFDDMPGQSIGAGTFPKVLGCALAICAMTLYLNEGRKSRTYAALAQWARSPVYLGNVVAVLGSLVFFALTAGRLGYHLSVFICLMIMLLKFGNTWRNSLTIAAVTAFVSHLFFYQVLRVPLPWGPLPVIY